MHQDALRLFYTGIDAADPYQAVKKSLFINDNHLEIAVNLKDGLKKRCGKWSQIHLIAFGKASCKMIRAAIEIIPMHLLAGRPLAITNTENVIAVNNCDVLSASHPIPDAAGLAAAKRLAGILKQCKANELVLILISGGGSALIPYPKNDISLKDKQLLTDLLLTSGANIQQINGVRKHLSQLKGGQLAKLAYPADCHALILSDVLDNDLSSIASGPTVPDNSTFTDAANILKEFKLWAKTPLTIRQLLEKGFLGDVEETPKENDICFKNTACTLIASNKTSLDSITSQAKVLGYQTLCYSTALTGEAKDTAEQFVLFAKQQKLKQSTAILAGGETTVDVKGSGQGGRNQEMALAFAIAAEKHQLKGDWVFLSGGTDGIDGPTDAAGGLVTPQTLNKLKSNHIDPVAKLNNNDAYSALKESKDLVITGATGTNVADLQVLLIQPEPLN